MSTHFARAQYRKTDQASVSDDPHGIILTTLRELERVLAALTAAQLVGADYAAPHLNRAFTAVYILQTSLDFDKGGEVATALFRVYEYCRQQLLAAFRRDRTARLDLARTAVAELAQAWNAIGAAQVGSDG